VEYQTPVSGEYSLSVLYFGRHLAASPYTLIVDTAMTGAENNCKVILTIVKVTVD
jgi:hypothetical protein